MRWKPVCYAMIMVIVHLGVAACSSEAPTTNVANAAEVVQAEPLTEPQGKGKRILAFGDSLYAGYGLAPNESFPAQLEQALRKQGMVVTIDNAGVSGDTSAAGRQRLDFTLDGLRDTPDLAIVGLGGNDMLRGVDPAVTRANLLAICRELRGRGVEVVLTGMLAAPNLGEDYGRRFNRIFPDVAASCAATLYPFFLDGVIGQGRLMLPDGIHPNGEGIRRIVAGIQPLIARELGKADAVNPPAPR